MNYNELNTIFLGADLCLEKNITADRMRQLVNKMYNCGLRLVRLYPYWAHIEEVEGKYRLEAYDACFKEAEKLGMKVIYGMEAYFVNNTAKKTCKDSGDKADYK